MMYDVSIYFRDLHAISNNSYWLELSVFLLYLPYVKICDITDNFFQHNITHRMHAEPEVCTFTFMAEVDDDIGTSSESPQSKRIYLTSSHNNIITVLFN